MDSWMVKVFLFFAFLVQNVWATSLTDKYKTAKQNNRLAIVTAGQWIANINIAYCYLLLGGAM